jgi:xanthosine utilization system XapX-like protein
MSEPITMAAVIGVLTILIGKSIYSISKRVKKSKCTNGGVEMDFSENQDCPEKQKREHKRHHRRKHRRDPLKHKNKAKNSETKLKKL